MPNEIEERVKNLLNHLVTHRKDLNTVIYNAGTLKVFNQAPISKTEFGRRKFHRGLETYWLAAVKANKDFVLLARVSETGVGKDREFFVYPALAENMEAVNQHLLSLETTVMKLQGS